MTKPAFVAPSALLSPFARDVLELYADALSDVRFPDLDLAALRALAGEVADALGEVDRLESELRDARERVAERAAGLHTRAERALSYARIYAQGNAELSERVAAILAQGDTEAAPKKRGRPRRSPESKNATLESAAE